jgi:two-component system cell cycle sensor histidine kinase/response regulator CckA
MPTILLVDDEPTMLALCQRILGLGGYEVLPAGTAEEAFRVLQNGTTAVDLLLSDVVMPGMNGIELANRVRSTHPNTKVVLMSGYGPRDIEKVAGGQNPYRIIWKPFKAESLLRMIENVLDSPVNPT